MLDPVGRHRSNDTNGKFARFVAGGCCIALIASVSSALPVNPTADVVVTDPEPAKADVTAAAAPAIDPVETARQIARCRAALRANPHDDAAYQLLRNLSSTLTLSAESSARQAAQTGLTRGFNPHETQRFVLLSDAQASLNDQHAYWLERTFEEFDRFTTRMNLRPLPLEHKLVCVLFEERDTYRAFAKASDGVESAITGYYSPRNDRVVFSLEGERSAPATADRGREPAEGVMRFDAETHSVAGHDHSTCAQGLSAKCVHETIHQLMFHTRIMNPRVQYPLWICEGLSTAFETHAPDKPFGPDIEFAPRRVVFEQLLERNDLLSLRDLVTVSHLPRDDRARVRAIYHQSYALVKWLCRERPEQLRLYLNLMREESAGRLSARRHLEHFETAFGDAKDLEAEWLRDERSALAGR